MDNLGLEYIRDCRKLRQKGFSLGEISRTTGLAKSTIYGCVRDIPISLIQQKAIESRNKERNKYKINPRKGKCLVGREVVKPELWSNDLVHIVSHFTFDGRVDYYGCIYYSKDKYQINHMEKLLYKIFRIKPKKQLRDNGVYGLAFYNVEFAKYIHNRQNQLFAHLNNGSLRSEKRVFLKAFFDDEGCVYYKNDNRRVRGYQKSRLVLLEVKKLLGCFGIQAKINKQSTDVEISGKENLIMFSKEINFSPGIYINPNRRNGVWRKRISKSNILRLALSSYQEDKFAH